MERPPRIDRGGARRLMVSTGGSAGSGADATPAPNAPRGAINHTFWQAKATYVVVVGVLLIASVHGPQHAWSSSGLLGSPPDSGAGDKESRMIKNLSVVGVVSMVVVSQAVADGAVQWRAEDGGNGHWYAVVVTDGDISWSAAQVSAISNGGDLAKISSSNCMQFVFTITANTPGAWIPFGNSWLGPWLGGRQLLGSAEPSGGWVWTDGTMIDLGAVRSDFNNSAGCGVNEDRLSFWKASTPPISTGTTDFVVSDFPDRGYCEPWYPHESAYVIEWSADCNNDGIVDYGQCRNGELADYDSDNTPDCCERGEACVVGNYPVQWQTTDGGNGHWYLLDIQQAGIDWPDANSISMASGGKLSQIESLMECQYLFDLSARNSSAWNQNGGGALGPWLGGRQQPGAQEPNGGWLWTDGSSIDFAACRFVGSDPSGCGINEDRMSFWCQDARDVYAGSVAYETSDYPARGICGNLGPIRAFLVEWSMDCNNDDIVDFGQILTGQLPDANANGIPDICEGTTCQDADLYRNGRIDGADLAALLSEWGPVNPFTQSDFNHDDLVDGSDLAFLLANWGPCPQ
jgi:hypothetical protein